MIRCKAKTKDGTRCNNHALSGSDFCHVHKNYGKKDDKRKQYTDPIYCSFCGKSQHELIKLISGPAVFICNECTDLCAEIILEEDGENVLPGTASWFGGGKKEIDIEQLGIKPRFNKTKFAKKSNHCFYLCPFNEPFDEIYNDHVKPTVEDLGFTIERADEIFGTQPIIEDIWESVNSAEIIIADVTGKNPNVMYEIGMAHTVGKPVVIITQDIDDVPFDLKHYRCIIYRYTPKGITTLETQIKGTFKFLAK